PLRTSILDLHDSHRRTLDTPRQVLREQAALDVGRAARGRTDQEREAPALEVGFLGACVGRRECGDGAEGGDGGAEHSVPRSRLALLRYRPGRVEDMLATGAPLTRLRGYGVSAPAWP